MPFEAHPERIDNYVFVFSDPRCDSCGRGLEFTQKIRDGENVSQTLEVADAITIRVSGGYGTYLDPTPTEETEQLTLLYCNVCCDRERENRTPLGEALNRYFEPF